MLGAERVRGVAVQPCCVAVEAYQLGRDATLGELGEHGVDGHDRRGVPDVGPLRLVTKHRTGWAFCCTSWHRESSSARGAESEIWELLSATQVRAQAGQTFICSRTFIIAT